MSTANGGKVVVVGGGVIGAACAHYLSRSGWRVTVLDKGKFGAACSHANCGYVSPSHVLPLAAPGAVRKSLISMFKPDSAFRIKPRFDPTLWGWLLRFARRGNHADMMESAKGINALLQSSRVLYDTLVKDDGLECDWQDRGILFVNRTAAGLAHATETAHLVRDHFGLTPELVEGDALTALEPSLKPGLAGAWLYRIDAHLRADKLMTSWHKSLLAAGVEVREGCEVTGIARAGSTATAVQTTQGDVTADAFVVAAGALTPKLSKSLGFKVPIQPGKGYSITMARPANCPTYPMIFEEHRVAITPFSDGLRIGSTMEFAGYNEETNPRRLAILRNGAAHYFKEPLDAPVQEEWWGWRPMTTDSRPIIGPSPAAGNLYVAAGHNMLGLSMATGTGKLVTELLNGQTPHVDPAPYSATRF